MDKEIFLKYNLPNSVKVLYKRNEKGVIFAKLPEYPGCMTLAHNVIELIENITDAILTYFEVPREIAVKCKFRYMPSYLRKLIFLQKKSISSTKITKEEEQSASFLLYGVNNCYGKYSNVR